MPDVFFVIVFLFRDPVTPAPRPRLLALVVAEEWTLPADSYWTNVIVNAVFLAVATVVGGVRTLCCRRNERRGSSSSPYGKFQPISRDDEAEDGLRMG